MKFYQLIAHGPMKEFSCHAKINSKKIFPSPNIEQRHIDEFKAKCCGNGLSDLDTEHVIIEVAELILEEA